MCVCVCVCGWEGCACVSRTKHCIYISKFRNNVDPPHEFIQYIRGAPLCTKKKLGEWWRGGPLEGGWAGGGEGEKGMQRTL